MKCVKDHYIKTNNISTVRTNSHYPYIGGLNFFEGQQAGAHIDGLAWEIFRTSSFYRTEYPLIRACALPVDFRAHSRVHAILRTGFPSSHVSMLVALLPRLTAGRSKVRPPHVSGRRCFTGF